MTEGRSLRPDDPPSDIELPAFPAPYPARVFPAGVGDDRIIARSPSSATDELAPIADELAGQYDAVMASR